MKVGLIVDDTLDKPDGVQQYVLSVGAWLSSQGHDVHYICGQTNRTDIPNIHSMTRNIKVRFNGNRLAIPLPVSRKRVRQLFADNDFDVLHVQTPHSPLLAQRVIMAAPSQTAVISTFHILPHSKLVGVLTGLLGIWLRPSIRRLQKMLAVSPAALRFAESTMRVKAQVLPNAIDLAPFFAAQAFPQYTDMPTIVYLNRLEERKGCIYLLRAIDELVHQRSYQKPFRVLIGGKGALRPQLEQYVIEHDLANYVTFLGFVPEDEKARYLASADIAIYPSTGGESFGIVLLEGLAAAKGVVLAGNNPGYASVLDIFKDQLFNPKDVLALATLLQKYLDDDRARVATVPLQRQYVADFDIAVVGQKLEQVYNDALRERQNVQ